jgi:major vault protein
MPEIQGQLVLAQNQHAFIQDSTKGTVQVYAGPYALALSGNDKPVTYDKTKDEFLAVTLAAAIKQNPLVPEGHYLVLENPQTDKDGKLTSPKGGANSPVQLEIGRKINVPGPASFPLWPGQHAQAVPGHHLRTNQYLFVRVYNAEEANKSVPGTTDRYTTGEQIVIKGTECSFYIPPNGFEVLLDTTSNSYVRDALTLERLEYCILLHENGNKRYEKGPQVVFPEATEKFIAKKVGEGQARHESFKFKAIELDDQMGLYIKVIDDYEEETGENYAALDKVPEGFDKTYRIDERTKEVRVLRQYRTGDELFIKGTEQRIYYPRAEHALIQYRDSEGKFNRDKYYGIAVPKGEARYVLDKTKGNVETVKGPQIFLPDPRHQVVVRRVLDTRTVELWYPGNKEAVQYNENLRSLLTNSLNYVAESALAATTMEATRSINRMTKGSAAMLGSFEGDKLSRGSEYTPPRTITLDTKYDGVPLIGVWTGYAVQVVDKSGNRRIVTGPASLLLEYDETLELMTLSTGKPKTTDTTMKTTYLKVKANKVSDVVTVETQDMVNVDIKVSYRVDFEGDNAKWFRVENYVKFMCDHLRSVLLAKAKEYTIEKFIQDGAKIVRDTVLGTSVEGKRSGKTFEENGMRVYDVEVLKVEIKDSKIAGLIQNAQTDAVQQAITLQVEARKLSTTKQLKVNEIAVAEAQAEVTRRRQQLNLEEQVGVHEAELAILEHGIKVALKQYEAQEQEQSVLDTIAAAELKRESAENTERLTVLAKETALAVTQMEAVNNKMLPVLENLSHSEWALKLTEALAPLAIIEQTSPGQVLGRLVKGTPLEGVFKKALETATDAKTLAASTGS